MQLSVSEIWVTFIFSYTSEKARKVRPDLPTGTDQASFFDSLVYFLEYTCCVAYWQSSLRPCSYWEAKPVMLHA